MWQAILLSCNFLLLVPRVEYRDCKPRLEASFETQADCQVFVQTLRSSWNEKRRCEKDPLR